MKTRILTLFFLVAINSSLISQGKFEADFGGGLFEAGSIKIKYGNNLQVGICQGFLFSDFWLTGAEVYYHIAGVSRYTDQHPYYIMGGVSSTLFSRGYSRNEKIVIYPRFGRTFSFSKRIGINLDAGPGLLMVDDIDGYHTTIIPTISAHLFVRL